MNEPDQAVVTTAAGQTEAPQRTWKPVLTLLLLSPAVGELLSGSSPPLQFFNPLLLLLLVGLYGCGALLVRETVCRFKLSMTGLVLLAIAYGIIEEGLTCKSFFNPHWKDVGYLSIYGRSLGVNWVWTAGLTAYHAFISIAAPIFITEAIFPKCGTTSWLRRRGWIVSATALGLVILLGFASFDSPEFHQRELKNPRRLAQEIVEARGSVAEYIGSKLTAKNKATLTKGTATSLPDLQRALLDELNRRLADPLLYNGVRFADITLLPETRQSAAKIPKGDKLVKFNRALLEQAFPEELAHRDKYPFYPPLATTAATILCLLVLIGLALRTSGRTAATATELRRPFLAGLWVTPAFAAIGFILPGLVENGAPIPAWVTCLVWGLFVWLAWRVLSHMQRPAEDLWRRGLWALAALMPWAFFGVLLNFVVQMIGAKNFSGMIVVSTLFLGAIVRLAFRWRAELKRQLHSEADALATLAAR